jgi:hypothetical protein
VSAATQRVPGYEIDPSTADPEAAGAAKLSQKVLNWGYDQWGVRKATVDTVKTAIGLGGSASTRCRTSAQRRPVHPVDGEMVGQGEIRIKVLGGNEVYWEPGVEFERRRGGDRAGLADRSDLEIPATPAGPLNPNALDLDVPNDPRATTSAPSSALLRADVPEMAARTVADDGQRPRHRRQPAIDPTAQYPWQDYLLQDAEDNVLDEPLACTASSTPTTSTTTTTRL